MDIKRYLYSIQSLLIHRRIVFYFQCFILFTSLFFISSIFIESIFYLRVKIKITLVIIYLFCLLIFISISLFQFIEVKKNRSKKYQLETIAKNLGELSFKNNPDTIINAYQLESNLRDNESNELAVTYVKQVLEHINKNNVIDKLKKKFNPIIKKFILSVWFFIIIFFSLNYDRSADAFYRLKNPKTYFEAPRPFKLISSTKNIV